MTAVFKFLFLNIFNYILLAFKYRSEPAPGFPLQQHHHVVKLCIALGSLPRACHCSTGKLLERKR